MRQLRHHLHYLFCDEIWPVDRSNCDGNTITKSGGGCKQKYDDRKTLCVQGLLLPARHLNSLLLAKVSLGNAASVF